MKSVKELQQELRDYIGNNPERIKFQLALEEEFKRVGNTPESNMKIIVNLMKSNLEKLNTILRSGRSH